MRLHDRILVLVMFASTSAALVLAQHGAAGHGVGASAFSGSRYGTFGSLAHPSSPPSHGYTPAPANSRGFSSFGTRSYSNFSPYSHGYSGYSGHRSGSGSYGHSGYRYRDYRRLPSSYFFAPYYYPFLSYGYSPFYDDSYDYGYGDQPQPSDDGPSADTAALSDQVQQLSAQMNDLRNGLQLPPPQYPYVQAPPYSGQGSQLQAAEPAPPAPPITLVLTNGQTVQVHSYAVMDNTFWDFSGQTAHKIPLSAIDIPASTKATETSGAEFPALQPAR